MDRNANRIASKNFEERAVACSRTGGGHTHRNGICRVRRAHNKAARNIDRRWVLASF